MLALAEKLKTRKLYHGGQAQFQLVEARVFIPKLHFNEVQLKQRLRAMKSHTRCTLPAPHGGSGVDLPEEWPCTAVVECTGADAALAAEACRGGCLEKPDMAGRGFETEQGIESATVDICGSREQGAHRQEHAHVTGDHTDGATETAEADVNECRAAVPNQSSNHADVSTSNSADTTGNTYHAQDAGAGASFDSATTSPTNTNGKMDQGGATATPTRSQAAGAASEIAKNDFNAVSVRLAYSD